MNLALRSEFDVIQQDQARLHRSISELDRRIDILSRKVIEPAPATVPSAFHTHTVPPPLPTSEARQPAPPVALPQPVAAPAVKPQDTKVPLTKTSPVPKTDSEPINRAPIAAPSPVSREVTEAGESWELAVGTVWLARIGIVILITGLVFLGNYAWQHVVSQLGAGGKLALLYLAGAMLGGIGTWLDRGKETMRNYARVLMAGGAATIYYATYASHFVERLRVIESPIIAGMLLLCTAGAFIAWADRRRSQTLGVMAILLAYYTSAINSIGVFTLFSGVLLSATAVFFLVRHRWTALGWLSIAGTYGSYGFWRWHHAMNGAAHAATADATLFVTVAFLACYWLLFTSAAFLGKESALSSGRPSLFITANNGAFFTLTAHQIATYQPNSFWLFAILFGGALLGLSAIARRLRTESPALEGSYLAQGIALVTLGLVSKLTGSQLALILALESAFLLTGAGGRHGWLYQLAAAITAAAATGVAGWEVADSSRFGLPLGGTVTAVMIGNAWWLKQRRQQLTGMVWSWRAAWFVVLALLLLGVSLLEKTPLETLPAVLAGLAVLLTYVSPRLRLPELLLSQLLLAWAAMMLLLQRNDDVSGAAPSLWSALVVITASLGLEQWWRRQRHVSLNDESRAALQLLCAIGAVGVSTSVLATQFPGESWIWASSAAAVVTLVYGISTRAWATALVGQFFTLLAAQAFLAAVWFSKVHPLIALVPLLTFTAIGVIIEYVIGRHHAATLPDGLTANGIARFYRLAATGGLVLWGLRFIPGEWITPFFVTVATLLVFAGVLTNNRERVVTGAVFHGIGLFAVWARLAEPAQWPVFFAILAVPASLRIARHLAGGQPLVSEEIRQAFTAAATCTAWLWTTRWTVATHGTQGLTMAWSALALLTFAAGLGLRERVYRIGGFSILTLAIARIFLVDVWRLETLYRILSFLVLGAVLLLLGFVYNRYAEKIRRWM